jgi:hypothetical protein
MHVRVCVMTREIHVRVERFLFVTQSNNWVIKCEASIKRRSGMQDKVTICDRNRIWCFEDSSLLFLERGNEIMLWGSRILYELCYAIVCLQDMYVIQERIRKKLLLRFKNFIMKGVINDKLCTMKCTPSYVRLVKWSRYLLRRFRTMT